MSANNSILFLSSVMKMGHGVSVVIERLAVELRLLGWDVHVASSHRDSSTLAQDVYDVSADIDSVIELSRKLNCSTVIAVTSPFFEMLPFLSNEFKTVAYEMGDPTPQLFPLDGDQRQLIVENKRRHVYPAVDKVLTISEFLRHDIDWLPGESIHLGCNHMDDFGSKGLQDFSLDTSAPLQVGTLMRLGEGESNYKGLTIFEELKSLLSDEKVEFHIMGKGSKEDKASWEKKGYKVQLNATDEERSTYLRRLDVFVSPSLWEGFNLPLVEAQASGTVSVALDTGAHPEVTPFTFKNVREMASQITIWNKNLDLLKLQSKQSYQFVRSKFVWEECAKKFSDHIKALNGMSEIPKGKRVVRKKITPGSRHIKAANRCVKQHGLVYTIKLGFTKIFK